MGSQGGGGLLCLLSDLWDSASRVGYRWEEKGGRGIARAVGPQATQQQRAAEAARSE